MSFPKKGRFFPGGSGGAGRGEIADTIALALRRELGGTRAAVKTVVSWTGASDRAARNWLSGRYGPSGEHLVALARHSDGVMLAVLVLAGRDELAAMSSLAGIRVQVRAMLLMLDDMLGDEAIPSARE